MDALSRLKARTEETNEVLLQDLLESAKSAILARRFPFGEWPNELETKYLDLQFRIALDLYAKIGAEGQTGHTENSISRQWESSWISAELLQEVTPMCGSVN
jgi:hypothetical protein